MTPAGLKPAIPGSVGRCLIHWATGPSDACIQRKFSIIRLRGPQPARPRGSNPRRPARKSAILPTELQQSSVASKPRPELALPAATGASLMTPAGLEPAIPGPWADALSIGPRGLLMHSSSESSPSLDAAIRSLHARGVRTHGAWQGRAPHCPPRHRSPPLPAGSY